MVLARDIYGVAHVSGSTASMGDAAVDERKMINPRRE